METPLHRDAYFSDAETLELPDPIMEFVMELRDLLARRQPAAISPSSTAIRPEEGIADVVLGHSLLEGFGLAVGMGTESASAFWVSYSTLGRSDDFDTARVSSHWAVGRFMGSRFIDDTVEQVRQELERPYLVGALLLNEQLDELSVSFPSLREGVPIWRRRCTRRPRFLVSASRREAEVTSSLIAPGHEIAALIGGKLPS